MTEFKGGKETPSANPNPNPQEGLNLLKLILIKLKSGIKNPFFDLKFCVELFI